MLSLCVVVVVFVSCVVCVLCVCVCACVCVCVRVRVPVCVRVRLRLPVCVRVCVEQQFCSIIHRRTAGRVAFGPIRPQGRTWVFRSSGGRLTGRPPGAAAGLGCVPAGGRVAGGSVALGVGGAVPSAPPWLVRARVDNHFVVDRTRAMDTYWTQSPGLDSPPPCSAAFSLPGLAINCS